MRTLRTIALGAVMAALIASPVAAASIAESLTVNSTLNVSGIPASINYGTVDPGGQSAVQSFTASITNNGPWTFKMSGSDFSGPSTIGKANRQAQLGMGSSTSVLAPSTWTGFDQSALDGNTTNAAGNAGSASFNVDLRVNVPGSAPQGAYSGTITYTVSGS